jgi:hypothetical protein
VDLIALADWHQQCGIETVAMQSTGVYWMALYDILEERGMRVFFGECARHQEHAGAEERCAGVSVVIKAARLWVAQQFFSAGGGNSGDENDLEAAAAADCRWRSMHSADAESAHADERATGECDQ